MVQPIPSHQLTNTLQYKLNALSCDFMTAGVQVGNGAVDAGKTAAKIGGGIAFLAGARGNLPLAALGGAYAACVLRSFNISFFHHARSRYDISAARCCCAPSRLSSFAWAVGS
jgi:hypothetical protein